MDIIVRISSVYYIKQLRLVWIIASAYIRLTSRKNRDRNLRGAHYVGLRGRHDWVNVTKVTEGGLTMGNGEHSPLYHHRNTSIFNWSHQLALYSERELLCRLAFYGLLGGKRYREFERYFFSWFLNESSTKVALCRRRLVIHRGAVVATWNVVSPAKPQVRLCLAR